MALLIVTRALAADPVADAKPATLPARIDARELLEYIDLLPNKTVGDAVLGRLADARLLAFASGDKKSFETIAKRTEKTISYTDNKLLGPQIDRATKLILARFAPDASAMAIKALAEDKAAELSPAPSQEPAEGKTPAASTGKQVSAGDSPTKDPAPATTAANATHTEATAPPATTKPKNQEPLFDAAAGPRYGETSGIASYFHTGVRLLSPYDFRYDSTTNQGFLDSGGSDATFYVEYVFSNRAAWNHQRLKELADAGDQGGWSWRKPDFEARITLNLAGAESEASAVMGSGNFGVEATLAMPAYLEWSSARAWSIGPEISYGVVTEKLDFEARERWLFGLGAVFSFQDTDSPSRRVLLNVRGGYIAMDSVRFINSATREIDTNFGGRPRYSMETGWGVETDLIYPVNDEASLTFGARIYSDLQPNTWTAYLGYTTSIGNVFGGVFPGLKKKDAPAQTGENAALSSDPKAPSTTMPSWKVPR